MKNALTPWPATGSDSSSPRVLVVDRDISDTVAVKAVRRVDARLLPLPPYVVPTNPKADLTDWLNQEGAADIHRVLKAGYTPLRNDAIPNILRAVEKATGRRLPAKTRNRLSMLGIYILTHFIRGEKKEFEGHTVGHGQWGAKAEKLAQVSNITGGDPGRCVKRCLDKLKRANIIDYESHRGRNSCFIVTVLRPSRFIELWAL